MNNIISLNFTIEELKNILLDYYGDSEETFDINEYSDDMLKNALLQR